MKLEQKAKFQPITITLETEEDATAFLDLIRYGSSNRPTRLKELAAKIGDWFINSAQLGD